MADLFVTRLASGATVGWNWNHVIDWKFTPRPGESSSFKIWYRQDGSNGGTGHNEYMGKDAHQINQEIFNIVYERTHGKLIPS